MGSLRSSDPGQILKSETLLTVQVRAVWKGQNVPLLPRLLAAPCQGELVGTAHTK